MLTNERLQEMRDAELDAVRHPFQHSGVKRRSEELAEALGELLERRVDCAELIFVARDETILGKDETIALAVEEEGVSPEIVANHTILTPEQSGEVRTTTHGELWGGK
jgi:hypothetical protein